MDNALKTLFGVLLFFVKTVLFALLSLIVVPSMVVMLTLHKTWEKMLVKVTSFDLSDFKAKK